MSKFKQYLEENERRYDYRIKTVVPLDDDMMDKIERALAKYVPLSISEVKKTIMQRNPLDFPSIDNAEVYYIDVTLSLPASSYILQQDIRYCMHVPEKFIVVRAPNEPTEVETQRIDSLHDIEEEAKEKGLVHAGRLSTDPAYPEAEPIDSSAIAGAVYNARFLDYLKTLQKEREELRTDVPVPSPELFAWLKEKPSAENYNKDVAPPIKAGKLKNPRSISNAGNFDDNVKFYSGTFKTKSGKKKIISKVGSAVDKGGK